MKTLFGGRSVVRLALGWTLLAMVPACQAQSAVNLDKHERKIHKRLERYTAGTYVNVEMRAGSDRAGLLGTVAPASFTLTDSDSNAQETHAYSEVAHVSRSQEYIGEGSVHHFFRPWVPVVLGVVAAGAAVSAFALR
jgi:hypothetical protein